MRLSACRARVSAGGRAPPTNCGLVGRRGDRPRGDQCRVSYRIGCKLDTDRIGVVYSSHTDENSTLIAPRPIPPPYPAAASWSRDLLTDRTIAQSRRA